ncbi:non-ribosomal peptide synthetase, partial [Rubrivivax gelatinosus]|uniref:non-ribosomal peptide synthetase n=1 Tax=Rubrivivax gelatinosus TaxID=28068 RepID=UPI0021756232
MFQVMLTVKNVPSRGLPGGSVDLESVPLDSASSKFDLTWQVYGFGERTGCLLEYNADLFEPSSIERIARHLRTLLSCVVADPRTPIDRLRLHDNADYALWLQQADGGTALTAPDDSVETLFQRQAARTPHAVAVSFEQEQLSYGALDRESSRLAWYLTEQGVGPGTIVAIGLCRSARLVTAMLAVLKAGAAYLPLDMSYPADRLSLMLEDSGAALLLTEESLLETLPPFEGQVVCLDASAAELTHYATDPLPGRALGGHAAYCIYTSGSTGRPKGALLCRGAFANLVRWYAEAFGGGPDDKVLVVSAIGFDLTQKNFFAPLCAGGQVHLLADGFDPRRIARAVGERRITLLNCTPSTFAALTAEPGADDWPALRHVFLGGEPVVPKLLSSWWHAHGRKVQLVNSYGPTECTDVVLAHRVDMEGHEEHEHAPLGRPLPGTRAYVLDGAGNPLPPGCVGEIFIGGPCVGRGYLGQAALTASRFVPDPFAGLPGARMYATGDLGRHADGVLEYLGRNDFQVKVRGVRIELGEIEAVLARQPGVREAVVVPHADASGLSRLVAYLGGDATRLPDEAELRRALSAQLPEYMVPHAFIALPALPLSPHGKIDRGALPAVDFQAKAEEAYEPPCTPTEARVAQEWAALLGLTQVGRQGDFFRLGGHSLLATRAVSRLCDAYTIELPLRALFEAPTVQALASHIDRLLAQGGRAQPDRVAPRAAGDALVPLSYAQ